MDEKLTTTASTIPRRASIKSQPDFDYSIRKQKVLSQLSHSISVLLYLNLSVEVYFQFLLVVVLNWAFVSFQFLLRLYSIKRMFLLVSGRFCFNVKFMKCSSEKVASEELEKKGHVCCGN